MHRWIASAAGGTSQRLKPGPAMMRSLSSRPGPESPYTGVPPGPSTVDMIACLLVMVLRSFGRARACGQIQCEHASIQGLNDASQQSARAEWKRIQAAGKVA